MTVSDKRTEHDSLGDVEIPASAPWGAQTGRAVANFNMGGGAMPGAFIRALGLIKATAARVNGDRGLLDRARADAIETVADEVAEGRHADAFPVDRFQTGSGTSTNMNMNEVVAHLASIVCGLDIHPNDHVNLGQSSNDTIPTAIHVSTRLAIHRELLPALDHLSTTLKACADEHAGVVKTGRTHLMDAVPMTLGQEVACWVTQVENARERIYSAAEELKLIAQGGTAIGTGINTHSGFAAAFSRRLSVRCGLEFRPAPNPFERIATQDAALSVSAQFRGLAVALTKIADDLRWMNSGPQAGLGEITLKALQPGSSIMPGKVNPVIPEAVIMAAAQVIGYDTAVSLGAQGGNFQLNTMLPLVACNLLESCRLLAAGAGSLADNAIRGMEVNAGHVADIAGRNAMLVTSLGPRVGYETAARIARLAMEEGKAVVEIACRETNLAESELTAVLDPVRLANGGDD
jgi:fumarate hydratase class II